MLAVGWGARLRSFSDAWVTEFSEIVSLHIDATDPAHFPVLMDNKSRQRRYRSRAYDLPSIYFINYKFLLK